MKKSILSLTFAVCCLLPVTAQTLSKADSLQNEIALLEYTSRLTRENFTVQLGTDGKVYRVLQEALQNHKLQSGTPVSTTCHHHQTARTGTVEIGLRRSKKRI